MKKTAGLFGMAMKPISVGSKSIGGMKAGLKHKSSPSKISGNALQPFSKSNSMPKLGKPSVLGTKPMNLATTGYKV